MENLVSVIVPCYNCEKLVAETINSIINQSYSDFEIITIDDCSKDNTLKVLKDLAEKDKRIIVIENQKNMGVALTRNNGVKVAKGEYIAFLDSDDIWHRDKLKIQMEYMLSNDVDMTATSYELYDESMENIINSYQVAEDISYNTLLYENVIGLSTVVMKKDVFNLYKMTNKYIHEDYELWLKLLKNGFKISGIKQPLVKYRVLDSSRNASKIKSLKGRVKILYYEENINPILICKYTFVYAIKGIIKYRKI